MVGLNNTEEILNSRIPGLHIYDLKEPFHIVYVSRSLVEITGYPEEELISEKDDLYLSVVHPSDRDNYRDFLKQAAKAADRSSSSEYRIVRKTGETVYVRDTMSVFMSDEGILTGVSVLTDITQQKIRDEEVRFLKESVNFGLMKYTCEKQPRITYINKTMTDILRFPVTKDGEADCYDMYMSNIYLMIPMEERRRFAKHLENIFSSEEPLAGDMSLLRCDGSRAHVFGWITKVINDKGVPEFQSVCMDISERYTSKKARETQRYLKALSDVYDKIFEFNIDANTVRCLHCEDTSSFKQFEGIAVQMGDAVDRWIINNVTDEDQKKVREFFRSFTSGNNYSKDSKPPQISYSAKSSTGEIKKYSGIFINNDDSVYYYCSRLIQDQNVNEKLHTENMQLKENMTELFTRFTDGLAAFEITSDGMVRPLYASENVYEFFGFSKEEWMPLTEKYTPIEQFITNGELSLNDVEELLRNGEAEFSYFDYSTRSEKKIRAICSNRENGSFSSRYIMLYSSDTAKPEVHDSLLENRNIYIRTFGYFDVFINDRPIVFRYRKSKELLALMIDRKGGFVSSDEAISFLWEDEPVSTLTLSRYRKVALRLKNTLEEYGISEIIESVDGKRRIKPELIHCDLYDYLSGKDEYRHLFKGSYLTNYSWAEMTLGELLNFQDSELT